MIQIHLTSYGIFIDTLCKCINCIGSPLGNIYCSVGPVMASSDRFDIVVRGKGGHGAAPQGTVDAIVEAAAVITGLQTVISRNFVSPCPPFILATIYSLHHN